MSSDYSGKRQKKKDSLLTKLEHWFSAFNNSDSEGLSALLDCKAARIAENFRHERFMRNQRRLVRRAKLIAKDLNIT